MAPVPETPLDDILLIDKWTHFVMYGTLVVVIMGEYGHRKRSVRMSRMLFFGLICPIVMGGLVELAQAYLTCGVRSGDWLDFIADGLGAVLGSVIGMPLAHILATRNRDGES